MPPASVLSSLSDWKSVWYGSWDGGRNALLASTSVAAGQEGSFNYRRNSKPISVHEAAERLWGAWMCIRVYRGQNRGSSSDQEVGCAWVAMNPLLNGGEMDQTIDMVPMKQERAYLESIGMAVAAEPQSAPAAGSKKGSDKKGTAAAAAATDEGAQAVEWSGKLQVKIAATGGVNLYRAGGRYLCVRQALLSGVPNPFTVPESEDLPLVADPEEEAALSEEDHAARAASCQDGEQNTHRFALLVRWPGAPGSAHPADAGDASGIA